MRLFVLILTLFSALHSYASCSGDESIDLRKLYPEIMSSLPIQDQGNFGYCYAYAGKFLYDFQRYLKASQTKQTLASLGTTSAAWAAALGMKEGTAFTDEGGLACNVVNGLSSRTQNCLQTSLSNESFHELGPQLYRLLFDHDQLMTQYQGQANPMWKNFPTISAAEFAPSVSLAGEKLKVKNGFLNFHRKLLNILAARGIPASAAASPFHYYDLVRTHHYKSSYPFLPSIFALSIAEKTCTSWKPSVKSVCKEGPAYDLEKVDSELTRGLPVGISYCSKMLTNHTYRGFPQSGAKAECGMHASVVIGRKSDEYGKCYYLIRNSWGLNKTKYDWKTDRGDIWVSSDALNDNIREYQTVH